MASPTLHADFFDGRSARARAVTLWLEHDQLIVHDQGLDGVERRYPLRKVVWPERTRHGRRQAQLPDGGVLAARDDAQWDAWALEATQGRGLASGLAVRWISSWRGALAALLAVIAVGVVAWRWGVPATADLLARSVPVAVEQSIGDETLDQLDGFLLQPSRVAADEQRRWREGFAAMVATQAGDPAAYTLEFRRAHRAIGPNAFALPGGTIIVTDQLLTLLEDQPDAVLGVLAHELGHVREQHGLRLMLRASLAGTLFGLAVGDFSSVLAGAPAILLHASYSRDFERAADAQAKRLLLDSGRSPRAMLVLFDRLAVERRTRASRDDDDADGTPEGDAAPDTSAGSASAPAPAASTVPSARERALAQAGSLLRIAISSHPADEERRRFFER